MTAVAASGLRARMESLDMLANNIANASTGGYKADREFYSLYVAPEAAGEDQPVTMPLVERPWTDMSQGLVHDTGNPLDVALSGKGFFAVNGPGGTLYTRNGNFHLAADGKLVTGEGYAVQTSDGASLALDPSRGVEIRPDGTVAQAGAAAGQIAVVDFANGSGLVKQEGSYFHAGASSTPTAASGVSIEQGKLEASNASNADAAVRLVAVMRQFEMLQKATSLASEMNRQAIEEVAKVGS
ncbi:MAG: flagellar basal-body rod protein FlgF [Bryobacteraceae bacterium]